MKLLFSLSVMFFLSITLSACSNKLSVGVNYQPNFNFSKVKHYSLYERNSEFTELQSIGDTARNALEIAIERAMDSQGFVYSALDKTDIIITYHLVNAHHDELSHYDKSVRYCQACLRANNWQQDTTFWALSPGSLVLDILDAKTKRSVWRSFFPLNIKVENNSQQMNEQIQQAITAMLSRYPR